MTITNNISTNFNFRTKFKRILNEQNISESSELLLIKAFEEFCSLDACTARTYLWRLTYSVNTAATVIRNLGLDLLIIGPKNFMVFRNELRFQYEDVYANLLRPSMDVKISPAFSVLVEKSDKIVASIVFDHCSLVMKQNDFQSLDRILFLLKSQKETNYFGGIRSLNFNMDEAEYLKPYHIEIHDLLASMKDFFENDVPFHMDEEVVVEEKIEEEKNESKEEILNEVLQNFKLITPEQLLINKDVFEAYVYGNDMNILVEIANLGFDLNEVMQKTEKIKDFMIAAENLS